MGNPDDVPIPTPMGNVQRRPEDQQLRIIREGTSVVFSHIRSNLSFITPDSIPRVAMREANWLMVAPEHRENLLGVIIYDESELVVESGRLLEIVGILVGKSLGPLLDEGQIGYALSGIDHTRKSIEFVPLPDENVDKWIAGINLPAAADQLERIEPTVRWEPVKME